MESGFSLSNSVVLMLNINYQTYQGHCLNFSNITKKLLQHLFLHQDTLIISYSVSGMHSCIVNIWIMVTHNSWYAQSHWQRMNKKSHHVLCHKVSIWSCNSLVVSIKYSYKVISFRLWDTQTLRINIISDRDPNCMFGIRHLTPSKMTPTCSMKNPGQFGQEKRLECPDY